MNNVVYTKSGATGCVLRTILNVATHKYTAYTTVDGSIVISISTFLKFLFNPHER